MRSETLLRVKEMLFIIRSGHQDEYEHMVPLVKGKFKTTQRRMWKHGSEDVLFDDSTSSHTWLFSGCFWSRWHTVDTP